ncbi:MAG TPA: hypothetical protein VLL52_11185 [Anaerolineae bacterium]|nr:hypothetical protein [Anaerolineae bacterium]
MRPRLTFYCLILFAGLALLFTHPLTTQASVGIISFEATSQDNNIRLVWITGFELNNLGFNIHRSISNNRDTASQINTALIPGQNNTNGSTYEYIDETVEPNIIYYYWIEDIDSNSGVSEFEGPLQVRLSGGTGIATNTPFPTNTPGPTNTPRPTNTPTNTPPATNTPLPTNTPDPSQPTNTPTNTPAPTFTPMIIATNINTNQPTLTPAIFPSTDTTNNDSEKSTPPPNTSSPATNTPPPPPTNTPVPTTLSPTNTPTPVAAIADNNNNNTQETNNPIGGQNSSDNQQTIDNSNYQNQNSNAISPLLILIAGLIFSLGGGIATWILLKRQNSSL